MACGNQDYTGEQPTTNAAAQGIALPLKKELEARRESELLPRRWVVERSFGWRDYERLLETLEGLPFVGFAILLMHRAAGILSQTA